ncbi:MAG: carboxypeptidase-like regulatory domain-containing protein [Bacteroidetes bacterium]|nr:carboxypeptidase-like regulatory domain-containing protein [Bacteroidota bacterium]
MTKDELSFQKMSQTEESHVNKYMSICGNLPNFPVYFTAVQDCNKKLVEYLALEVSGSHPDKLTKKQLREKLVDECSDVMRKMYAYAVNENLNDLIDSFGYSHSFLKITNESNLNSICLNVLDKAGLHQANLTNYGITATSITMLQQSLNDFNTIRPISKQEKAKNKENRLYITQLFAKLRENWNKMDNLMEILRQDHTDFYYEYHQLRKLEKPKSANVDLSVKMYDKESGQAVSLVNLSLMPAAGMEQERFEANAALIEKKTRMYGCFFRNLSAGDYLITARKAGYADTTKTITIVKGEYTTVNIVMEKL